MGNEWKNEKENNHEFYLHLANATQTTPGVERGMERRGTTLQIRPPFWNCHFSAKFKFSYYDVRGSSPVLGLEGLPVTILKLINPNQKER